MTTVEQVTQLALLGGTLREVEARRLVPVDVAGMRIKYTDDVAAPGGSQPPAQCGPSASGGEDLPF